MRNRLDEIIARLNATTKGRWVTHNIGDRADVRSIHAAAYGGYTTVATAADSEFGACPAEDAEFIANAPADIAYLLAELRKATR